MARVRRFSFQHPKLASRTKLDVSFLFQLTNPSMNVDLPFLPNGATAVTCPLLLLLHSRYPFTPIPYKPQNILPHLACSGRRPVRIFRRR